MLIKKIVRKVNKANLKRKTCFSINLAITNAIYNHYKRKICLLFLKPQSLIKVTNNNKEIHSFKNLIYINLIWKRLKFNSKIY